MRKWLFSWLMFYKWFIRHGKIHTKECLVFFLVGELYKKRTYFVLMGYSSPPGQDNGDWFIEF